LRGVRDEAIPFNAERRSYHPKEVILAETEVHRVDQESLKRTYFVYIMTNEYNTVFYTGVTNDLVRRVFEHKEGLIEGFTKKYNVKKLVYFEIFGDVYEAIAREKQIKGGSRKKKYGLVRSFNSRWKDLIGELDRR